MMHNTAFESSTLRLHAGERRVLRMPAHSRWVATRGQATLSRPPRWLGDRLLIQSDPLREGESLRIDEFGWVTLEALSDCTLICDMPIGVWSRLAAAWRIIRVGRPTRAVA